MPTVSSWPYKKIVAVTFVVSVFMDVLDVTIVNVALKTIGEKFGASETGLEWVVTGYILSLAIWIPASGWLGDRIGTKRVFLFALGMFTLGSALCGLSWNIGALNRVPGRAGHWRRHARAGRHRHALSRRTRPTNGLVRRRCCRSRACSGPRWGRCWGA